MNSTRRLSKRILEKTQKIIKKFANIFNKPDNICQVYCVIMKKKGGWGMIWVLIVVLIIIDEFLKAFGKPKKK